MAGSTDNNARQGLLPDRNYKEFIKKNRKGIKETQRQEGRNNNSGEFRMIGGMSGQENAHITKTGQDPEKYLKTRKERYGY